jgi:DNA-binding CsgD family transcriptional regulator
LKEAARRLGISEGSAWQYLKIIFRKTGTNRQADLVRKLNAVPMGHFGSADTAQPDAPGR